jgi:phosphoserine phosphatase RsbU/P
LTRLLKIILDIAVEKTRAETGTIYVVDKNKNEIWSKAIHNDKEVEFRLPIGQGIAGHVAATGETLNICDVYTHPQFSDSYDKQTGFQTRCMLCMPMRAEDGEIIGVFQIINHKSGQFTSADEEFLSGLSVHAALAIGKAALHQESIEKRALERDMSLARDIQKYLLPPSLPALKGYECAAENLPAAAIGGDYFDFIMTNDNKVCFAIGDVAGKGISAALLMASLRTALHVLIFKQRQSNPVRLLTHINIILTRAMPRSRFISFFYGELVPQTGKVFFVNAGHLPPFYIKSNGTVKQLLGGGLPLGLKATAHYEIGEITLRHKEVIFMFTDGVTEAMNVQGEEYGENRLTQLLMQNSHLNAQELQNMILKDINEFRGNTPQNDDITLAIVKRN